MIPIGAMRFHATVIYDDPLDGSQIVRLGLHEFQCGGNGDGFCYAHQEFDCMDELTPDEWVAMREAS